MEPDNPLARKLQAFASLAPDDLALLQDLHDRRRDFPAGRDLIHQGQKDQPVFLLTRGWVCSYKLLSGGARQIVDVRIPGDFLGLRTVMMRRADLYVEPITRVQAAEVPAEELMAELSGLPRLARAVLWSASRDEAMLVEHLVGLGRRNAAERTGHFLLELAARLRLVGLGDATGFDCPLSQYLMADALGLSAVHVNRVLRELREAGLVTFQHGRVDFTDVAGLAALADFDRAYLDQDEPLWS